MKNQNYANLSGIIRTVLSLLGAYLLGKNIYGIEATAELWQEATGVIMGVIAIIWSIRSKEATIEMLQGTMRQVLTFIGGLFVAKGKISAETLTLVIGLAAAILPPLYGFLSRRKTQQLDTGKISIDQLKK